MADQTPIAGPRHLREITVTRSIALLGYTPSARWRSYDGVFADSLASFAPLTDRRYLDVQPKRVKGRRRHASPVTVDGAGASEHGATVSADVLALDQPGRSRALLCPRASPRRSVVGGRLPGEGPPLARSDGWRVNGAAGARSP